MNSNSNSEKNKKPRDLVGDITVSALVVLFIIAMYVITGLVVQYTWNKSVAELFNVKEITLNQSIALFVLTGILFGGKETYVKYSSK